MGRMGNEPMGDEPYEPNKPYEPYRGGNEPYESSKPYELYAPYESYKTYKAGESQIVHKRHKITHNIQKGPWPLSWVVGRTAAMG